MLKDLEGSEDLKVSLSGLKEQLETLEEAGDSVMQIAKQARNERGQKLFQIFRQEENEVYIAHLARWDTQLKGLVELERLCSELREEVELLSENLEVLAVLMNGKVKMQKTPPEQYQEKMFEELKELEEQTTKVKRRSLKPQVWGARRRASP